MKAASAFKVVEEACCSPASSVSSSLHENLTMLLSEYDVNAGASSVKVYAIKPLDA